VAVDSLWAGPHSRPLYSLQNVLQSRRLSEQYSRVRTAKVLTCGTRLVDGQPCTMRDIGPNIETLTTRRHVEDFPNQCFLELKTTQGPKYDDGDDDI